MTIKQIQISTGSLEQTRKLGQQIGSLIRSGIVLAFRGDLGSGKTSLIQGIAKGLDVSDGYYVTSPTYTLINEYPGRHPLVHVDLYRIENMVDLNDIGLYDLFQDETVIAIEWAEKLDDDIFTEYISIDMNFLDNDSRQINLTAYGLKATDLLKRFERL